MKKLLNLALAICFCLTISNTLFAQNVSNIDVDSQSTKDIEKAQQAMHEAGLTLDQAAEIAKQKGATNEQIQEFEQRISSEENDKDSKNKEISSLNQIEKPEKEDNTEQSTRETSFEVEDNIFGNKLFNNNNLSFEPNHNIQTPKNYEIGISDQVLIQIWGNSQNSYQLIVNKNGQIVIPNVGPVYIAGLTFEKAEEKIKEQLTKIYADLGGKQPGTFAQVSMGQLRSIQINLVGESRTPGTYVLPVTATLFNALYLSGGPNQIGSFREIKLIRDNQLFKTIDIYKFLVDADPSDNILLKDNDIIFIPPASKRVTIEGAFNRNGIFEVLNGEHLNDLARYAGGFTDAAYLSNVQINRKLQNGQQLLDVAYDDFSTTELKNGDVINSNLIVEEYKNRVTINGAVYRPGDYEWKSNLTLKELILKADSLNKDVYQKRGLITRLNADKTTQTIPFDINRIMNGLDQITLQPEDIITLKSHFEIGEQPYLTISGEVMNPGVYEWSDSTTLSDLIYISGGLKEGADSTYIEVSRKLSKKEASQYSDTLLKVFIIDHNRDLAVQDASFKLQPFDHISVKMAPGYREQGSATITGEVKYTGTYAIRNRGQKISDLLELAKGTTPHAYLEGATLNRYSEELGNEQIAINLKKIMKNPGGIYDLQLRDGDLINIPTLAQTVKVTGAVQNPYSITYDDSKKLKFYINRVGGFGSKAHKKKVYVKYPNGYTLATQSFMIRKYPPIVSGCEIVVPEKPEREGNLGQWLSAASTLSSLAISAVAIVNLSKK